MSSENLERISIFLKSTPVVEAASPLKKTIQIRLQVDGQSYSITKQDRDLSVRTAEAESPDLTFSMGQKGLQALTDPAHNNAPELALCFLKRLTDQNSATQIQAAIHVGIFDFIRKGYLGLFAVGGTTLMKEMASMGFGSLGKIKNLLTKIRTKA